MRDERGENQPHHVVLVGRSGDHPGTGIYLTERGTKPQAVATGEETFRRENRLPSNVALVARVVFSGEEPDAVAFIERLIEVADDPLLARSQAAHPGRATA